MSHVQQETRGPWISPGKLCSTPQLETARRWCASGGKGIGWGVSYNKSGMRRYEVCLGLQPKNHITCQFPYIIYSHTTYPCNPMYIFCTHGTIYKFQGSSQCQIEETLDWPLRASPNFGRSLDLPWQSLFPSEDCLGSLSAVPMYQSFLILKTSTQHSSSTTQKTL